MLFSKFHHVVISDYFANSYLPCHNEQNLFSLFLPKRKRLLKAFSVLFWVIFLFIAECSSFEMLPLTFVMLILSCCLLSMLIIVKVDYCQCWVLSMLIFVNVDYCQCWLLSMLTIVMLSIVNVDYCQSWLLSMLTIVMLSFGSPAYYITSTILFLKVEVWNSTKKDSKKI